MSHWRFCSVKDCLRIARCHGLCEAHYKRQKSERGLRPEIPINARFQKRMLKKAGGKR
jgi:hypothetical protein